MTVVAEPGRARRWDHSPTGPKKPAGSVETVFCPRRK